MWTYPKSNQTTRGSIYFFAALFFLKRERYFTAYTNHPPPTQEFRSFWGGYCCFRSVFLKKNYSPSVCVFLYFLYFGWGLSLPRLLCKSCADKTLKAFGSTGAAVVGGPLLLAPYQSFLISVWLPSFFLFLSLGSALLSFLYIYIHTYNAHSAMPILSGPAGSVSPQTPCLLLLLLLGF